MRALADSNAEHFPFASRSWLSARERSSLAETTLARYDSTTGVLVRDLNLFLLEAVHELATRRVRLGELSLEDRPGKSWGFSAGRGMEVGRRGKGRGVAGRRARSRASGGAGGKARA